MKVIGFDHIVLVVADVDRALGFYCDELGLAPVRVDEWRKGEAPFPSARVDGGTIIDFVPGVDGGDGGDGGRNLDHLCLVVTPESIDEAQQRYEILDGPSPRFGAQGIATSVYIRDPDGNIVELRSY